MAANTKSLIRHRCGHLIDWDLTNKPPDKRAGLASWLAQRDCTRCWWTKRRNHDRRTQTLLRQRHKPQHQAATHVWEVAAGMPALQGSDQAVAWARRIRHRLLLTARDRSGTGPGAERDFTVGYTTPARRIAAAGWWIDHRHATPTELRRLLAVPSPSGSTPGEGR